MTEKKMGYALLGIGIAIMLFAFVYILLVFTGQREPVQALSIPAPKIDLSSLVAPGLPQTGVALPKTEIEVIPTAELNKMLNMTISLLLSGFVMSFGFKLASLGVMSIKTLQVKLKESPLTPQ